MFTGLRCAASLSFLFCVAPLWGQTKPAGIKPDSAIVYFDFREGLADLADKEKVRQLVPQRIEHKAGQPLEFAHAKQSLEIPSEQTRAAAMGFTKTHEISIGGWFLCRRTGEQTFFQRGNVEVAPLGERMFRQSVEYVNFCLGTDQHGFFYAAINGNGSMPFPLVTLNEVPINTWNQLVLVKDERGYQHFYQNGVLIHDDRHSMFAGKRHPHTETQRGPSPPIELAMPHGGLIGEAWAFGRALTADEIRADYEAKKDRYKPAPPGKPVLLREMNAHPAAGLWPRELTKEGWPGERRRIEAGVMKILGPFPKDNVPLDPQTHGEEDCGTYVRRKISIAVQPDDRMTAYLLIPKKLKGKAPAIICFYGTTSGAGKKTTVGLTGPRAANPNPRAKLHNPVEPNRAFAVDMVEAGFVAFAADYLRDGERVKPGHKPYDSTDFYARFPEWSVVGKDVWDNMRAIDYLQSLEFVDGERIGMVGHSYGGHSTIFAAALEPRTKAAFANGPVSDFRDHGLHWGRPNGAGGGEYLRPLRPYVLDHTLPIPATFYEFTSLIAPRPLMVGQAVGERRPKEEENHAAVAQVYQALGMRDRVSYVWYPGDHDFPPHMRQEAVKFFKKWLTADSAVSK